VKDNGTIGPLDGEQHGIRARRLQQLPRIANGRRSERIEALGHNRAWSSH